MLNWSVPVELPSVIYVTISDNKKSLDLAENSKSL